MPRAPMTKARSLAVLLAAYAAAAAAAVAVVRLAGDRLIPAALLADLAATVVVFAFSLACDNSSLYDPYWSVAPVAIAAFWLVRSGAQAISLRQLFVLALLALWATRLTLSCLLRWKGMHHEDWRYSDFRRVGGMYWPVSFLGFHLFPTLIVFLGCVALLPTLGPAARPVGLLDALAAAVTLSAIWIEAAADRQLRRFLAARSAGDGESGGRHVGLLETGLWALSRHPNYFGEVLFWWGLWLFGLAADPSWWWTIAGPIAITAMFLGVSVPMMDRHMLARRPEYAGMIQRHSGLVPWFTSEPSGSRRRRTPR
jgi:steroid 5-alpha reductase family enzyme